MDRATLRSGTLYLIPYTFTYRAPIPYSLAPIPPGSTTFPPLRAQYNDCIIIFAL